MAILDSITLTLTQTTTNTARVPQFPKIPEKISLQLLIIRPETEISPHFHPEPRL